MTLTVAVGELTRVLPWSLRALGYPFGTADRAARLVATAAALDPSVLDRIAKAGQRPKEGVRILRGTDGLKVDANGVSLFETGAVVIDYLAAHADETFALTAELDGATGIELVAAILSCGAEYGLTCVALLPKATGGGWVVAIPDQGGPRIYEGFDREALLSAICDDRMVDRIQLAAASRNLVFVASQQPVQISFSTSGVDVSAAVATANSEGVPVSEKTLKALYGLEMITWAPTSERSRAQAGFTPKPIVAS